jgi:hypothetical protein
MNYLDTLKSEATKTVAGLGETVAEREKQVASIEDRIKYEHEDVDRRAENLARFKEAAGAQVARGTSQYREWQHRFGRLSADLATARAALALLESDIAPATKAALAVARKSLSQALTALCLAGRPRCEARMAELLDVVIAEHDEFYWACDRLHRDYGQTLTWPEFDLGAVAEHPRLGCVAKRTLVSPAPYLAFTRPPAPPVAQTEKTPPEPTPAPVAPPPQCPGVPADAAATPVESTPTAQVGETVKGDGPKPPEGPCLLPGDVAPTPAEPMPEAPADLDAPQDAETPQEAAQDAPGDTRTPALDTEATDKQAPDAADQGDPDTDLDAQDNADAEAEGPPAAGKENPGIAADCA